MILEKGRICGLGWRSYIAHTQLLALAGVVYML